MELEIGRWCTLNFMSGHVGIFGGQIRALPIDKKLAGFHRGQQTYCWRFVFQGMENVEIWIPEAIMGPGGLVSIIG